jgi:hypothetical protein
MPKADSRMDHAMHAAPLTTKPSTHHCLQQQHVVVAVVVAMVVAMVVAVVVVSCPTHKPN